MCVLTRVPGMSDDRQPPAPQRDLPRYTETDVRAALADPPARDRAPRVVGVLLAAGSSERFGVPNKLLASLNGERVVVRAARTLCEAALDRVVVVLGHDAEAVRAALDDSHFDLDFDVGFVFNAEYADGLSTSVRAGVDAAAAAEADAAVFLPADMPAVSSGTVDLLVDAYRGGIGTALAAAHDGRRGNPVLFDAGHFDALRDLDGDVGGREVLFGADEAALIEAGDPGVFDDIDTERDLREQG